MSMILVVEDEPDMGRVLEFNLAHAGYEVAMAACGVDGLRLAHELQPELVLLDLMLPDIPGTELCRTLRQDPATRGQRIMIVTAKEDEIDRIVGFELGADDYVTKPFSMRELLLRIRAILRRPVPAETPVAGAADGVEEYGALRLDRPAHRAWLPDGELFLTALEFRLLVTLIERGGRVQSREALLEAVWERDAKASPRTVDAHIKRLRQKLGGAAEIIQTVRGVGYRFARAPGRYALEE